MNTSVDLWHRPSKNIPSPLPQLATILKPAARYTRESFRSEGLNFEGKDDGTRVTEVDRRLDHYLQDKLAELDMGPVRSEESKESQDGSRLERGWVVDPIDGTHPFTEGESSFSIQLAYIEGGRPIWSALALPVLGQLYLAGQDEGVWRLSPDHPKGQTWSLPEQRMPNLRISTFFGEGHQQQVAQSARLELGEYVRAIGPLIAMIFSGEASTVVGPPYLLDWDLAPPELIATELGARVSDIEGQQLEYGRPDIDPGKGIVVTAPGVAHDRIIEALQL